MIRVPVFRTILGTYFFIWYQRGEFLLLAIPTIVVIVFLGALGALAVPEIPTGAGRGGEIGGLVIALGAILGVLFTAASVMFSVAWHRRYLVPDEPANVHTALRWGRRQTRFLLLAIGLAVLSAGVFLVGGLVGSILGLFIVMGGGSRLLLFLPVFGLFVLVGLIYARLSLLFPSTAVDHRMSFGECWAFTRGNGWRLFIIIFLVAIPFSLIA
jgi:hypothetical protein